MRSIPIYEFIDGIVSAGAHMTGSFFVDGYQIEWYLGPRGRCSVILNNEEILEDDVRFNLEQLGYEALMDFFFP